MPPHWIRLKFAESMIKIIHLLIFWSTVHESSDLSMRNNEVEERKLKTDTKKKNHVVPHYLAWYTSTSTSSVINGEETRGEWTSVTMVTGVAVLACRRSVFHRNYYSLVSIHKTLLSSDPPCTASQIFAPLQLEKKRHKFPYPIIVYFNDCLFRKNKISLTLHFTLQK